MVPLAHLLASGLETAFLCAVVVFVHGAVGRFVSRERFEAFATWAQVGLSVMFVLGYQLAMPLIFRIGEADAVSPWILAATPPGWFACLGAILAGANSRAYVPGALAGIVLTTSLGWLAIRRLAAGLAENVDALDEARVVRAGAARSAERAPLRIALGRLLVSDPVERAAFNLAAAYMARDRETKLRLYPSLATLLLVPAMALLRPDRSSMSGPAFSLFGLVMVATLSLSVVETLSVSSHHAASDVFRSAPLASAGGLFQGVRKASLLFVALPAVLATAALIALTFRGGREGLIAGIPLILAVPTVSLLPGALGDYLPLSRPVVQGEIGSQTAVLMLMGTILMGGVAAVGFFAYRAGRLVPVVAAEALVLVVVHVAASRAIRSRRFPAS